MVRVFPPVVPNVIDVRTISNSEEVIENDIQVEYDPLRRMSYEREAP